MRKILLMFVYLFMAMAVNAQQPKGKIKKIEPIKLESKLSKKNIQLVDVRTLKEFEENHIEKAVNIDVEASDFEEKVKELDKRKPVYVYCRSGKRSSRAAQKLSQLGFKKIYDVEGGIINWELQTKK